MSVDLTTAPTDERSGTLAGTGTLVRFMLRRDRVRIPAWAGGLMLFMVYVITALEDLVGTDDLAGATQLFREPIGRLLVGPGYGFDDPSLERFVAGGYGLYFLVLAAIMSILLVARHTRVEEQTGRAELVRANVVGRHAALTATMIVAGIANTVVAALVWLTLIGLGGFAAGPSLLLAAGIAALGMVFAGITTITVQLSEYSRTAAGMAGGVLGASFLLRAVGDMAAQGGTAVSWASPLGWAQQTAPFVLDRWWPLALLLALAAATTTIGYAVSTRRDLAASIFAVRPGPAEAAPALGTAFGLAFRLQRASIIGWTAALMVSGLVLAAYADAFVDADLPEVFLELFTAEDLIASYLSFMPLLIAYFAACFAVLAVQGLRTEETTGRAEPVLATPVSRWAWIGSNLTVSAGASVVIMAMAGLASGVGAAIVTGDGAYVWELTLAHLNHVPAVLVVLGVAALLFGYLPQAIPVTWLIVGYALFAGTFGPMLDVPQAMMNLSPFEHAAELPLESFRLGPILVLLLVAAATTVLGMAGLRRRGINVT